MRHLPHQPSQKTLSCLALLLLVPLIPPPFITANAITTDAIAFHTTTTTTNNNSSAMLSNLPGEDSVSESLAYTNVTKSPPLTHTEQPTTASPTTTAEPPTTTTESEQTTITTIVTSAPMTVSRTTESFQNSFEATMAAPSRFPFNVTPKYES